MNLNKKGFMMAEVVVVSFIVMGILLSIYSSYSSVIRKYNHVMDYYNIDYIYELASIRDELIRNNEMDNILSETEATNCLYNENKKVFFAKTNNINCINGLTNVDIKDTLKDYITYLQNSVDLSQNNYVMIIERAKSKGVGNDSYYYNYLGLE